MDIENLLTNHIVKIMRVINKLIDYDCQNCKNYYIELKNKFFMLESIMRCKFGFTENEMDYQPEWNYIDETTFTVIVVKTHEDIMKMKCKNVYQLESCDRCEHN